MVRPNCALELIQLQNVTTAINATKSEHVSTKWRLVGRFYLCYEVSSGHGGTDVS